MKPKIFVFVTLTGFLCAYVAMAYALAYTLAFVLGNPYWRHLELIGREML